MIVEIYILYKEIVLVRKYTRIRKWMMKCDGVMKLRLNKVKLVG